RISVGHSLRNPSDQEFVIARADFNALAAAVRDGGGGFEQEQRAIGCGRRQSAAARFIDEPFVVFSRLKTEKRKSETILPARFSVAAAAVAAGFAENRDDLVGEIDGFVGFNRSR